MLSLFASVSFFSLVDLATTIRAYAIGLSEGNYLVLGMARVLGLGTLWTLVAFKATFIISLGLVVLLGVHTRSPMTRRMAFALMAAFTVVFLAVSVNNLAAIAD